MRGESYTKSTTFSPKACKNALRSLLKMVKQYNFEVDHIEGDNKMLIDIFKGVSMPDVYMDVVARDINILRNTIGGGKCSYIPRHANKVAHFIASGPDMICIRHNRDYISSFIEMDVSD